MNILDTCDSIGEIISLCLVLNYLALNYWRLSFMNFVTFILGFFFHLFVIDLTLVLTLGKCLDKNMTAVMNLQTC
jgi:hypothetical protein